MSILPLLSGLVGLSISGSMAHAASYYVATNGDDNRSPTMAQNVNTPWRTIQKAADAVSTGDAVWIRSGTYNESVRLDHKNGAPNAYIKFLRYTGDKEKPVIKGLENTRWAFQMQQCSYIELNGLEFTSPNPDGVGVWGEGGHHLRVYYSVARDCGESGISMKFGDYIDILGCWCFNNSKTGIYHGSGISLWKMAKIDDAPGYHNSIVENTCFNNKELGDRTHTDGNGIIIDESSNHIGATLVSKNNIYENGGRGLQVYRTSNVTAEHNTIRNNLKDVQISDGEMTCVNDSAEYKAENVIFRGNTITSNANRACIYVRGITNFQESHNTLNGGSVDWTKTNN